MSKTLSGSLVHDSVRNESSQMFSQMAVSHVVAFMSASVPSLVPEVLGMPSVDAHGNEYGKKLRQRMLVFKADLEGLQKAHRVGLELELELELKILSYIFATFSPGNAKDSGAVFMQENPENLQLAGLAL